MWDTCFSQTYHCFDIDYQSNTALQPSMPLHVLINLLNLRFNLRVYPFIIIVAMHAQELEVGFYAKFKEAKISKNKPIELKK